jgi:hypothetical protein
MRTIKAGRLGLLRDKAAAIVPKGVQGRHEWDLDFHKEIVEQNNIPSQEELDLLNAKWNEDKKSLTP